MKVNVNKKCQGCYLEDIVTGTVFYGEDEPDKFWLRTDEDDAVAVNLETGVIYYLVDFDEDKPIYHTVDAVVNIGNSNT